MGLFSKEPTSYFPVSTGRRMDHSTFRIPHDLPADATLLIVAFQDSLDPLSDQWARLGSRLADAHDGRFAVLETPIVSAAFKHLGGLGTIGVRHQIDSEDERDRTVPLFVDTKRFRKVLRLDASDVTALLVARDGRIAWRGDGEIDMEEIAALEAAIEDVLGAPTPPYTDHPDVSDESPPADSSPAVDSDPVP
ncbi:MAG: hypothetical protein AAGK21_10765 [Bacteroidota bacterium]